MPLGRYPSKIDNSYQSFEIRGTHADEGTVLAPSNVQAKTIFTEILRMDFQVSRNTYLGNVCRAVAYCKTPASPPRPLLKYEAMPRPIGGPERFPNDRFGRTGARDPRQIPGMAITVFAGPFGGFGLLAGHGSASWRVVDSPRTRKPSREKSRAW